MIDHIGITVSNFEKSKTLYEQALAPLGYELVMEFPGLAGLGIDGKPDFWINEAEAVTAQIHIAFRAKNRSQVEEFYKAAISAGGKDNGAPGIREHYHTNYYGAFVLDFDGHNFEAVCHKPED